MMILAAPTTQTNTQPHSHAPILSSTLPTLTPHCNITTAMATAGYMVDVLPEPTGTQAAVVHVTPPPPPPAGDSAPPSAAGNGGTPALPPHPGAGGDTSLSSLLLSAHHNVVIAGAMMYVAPGGKRL